MKDFVDLLGFPPGCCFSLLLSYTIQTSCRYDYVNKKEYYSINLQGLVDNKYLFQDIFDSLRYIKNV